MLSNCDLVSNVSPLLIFCRYQMKCKSVSNVSPRYMHLEASSDASVLLLSGEPLNEPIVGYGPFVMNTKQEIAEAVRDFNSGRFGQI